MTVEEFFKRVFGEPSNFQLPEVLRTAYVMFEDIDGALNEVQDVKLEGRDEYGICRLVLKPYKED